MIMITSYRHDHWQEAGLFSDQEPIMNTRLGFVILAILVFFTLPAQSETGAHSQYSGQENRDIKSLSPADIDELQRGSGWGLAKAAELNGVPGPAHLLELKDEIPLSQDQVGAITKIYESMRAQAIEQGEAHIRLERELEQGFRNQTITEQTLKRKLGEISTSRGQLRYTHLVTHLKTPELLSTEQIARYNALRGYSDNPCALPPEGHDLARWRAHNNCP